MHVSADRCDACTDLAAAPDCDKPAADEPKPGCLPGTPQRRARRDGGRGSGNPRTDGYAIAALSVGMLAAWPGDDRLSMAVELLKRQTEIIGPQANPFDVAMLAYSRSCQ
jgi:hypothetical protein